MGAEERGKQALYIMVMKTYLGTVRTTYLIDENGIILKAYEKVKPETDSETVLKDIENAKL